MIEKVAEALYHKMVELQKEPVEIKTGDNYYKVLAKAAIEAMREPTDEMINQEGSPSGLPFKNVFLHGSYYITKWDCKTGEVSTVEYKVRGNKFTDIWMDEMAEPKTFTLNLNKTGQLQSRQDPNKPRLHSTKAVNKVTLVKLNLPPAYEDDYAGLDSGRRSFYFASI